MYSYDAQAAHDADNNSGPRYISETGAYTGKIVKAIAKKTSKGGDQVTIAFESDQGQKSDYLTLQTQSQSGEKYFGYGILMSILRCAGVRAVTLKKLNDKESELPELSGKPVGLVLQATEYQKTDGSIAEKMEPVAAFQASTRKMSVELDENKPAAQLEKLLANLPPLRKLKNVKSAPQSYDNGPAPTSGFQDDDIPF